MRNQGYVCQVVEKTIPHCFIKKDLFGFIDILAMKVGEQGLIGIQTTSTGNMNARIKKIGEEPLAEVFLKTGNRVVVHGWAKRGPRGKRKVFQLKEFVYLGLSRSEEANPSISADPPHTVSISHYSESVERGGAKEDSCPQS
jgi:hypothetical protein